MKRLILALAALVCIASTDPVADTRQIMAGTVTTKSTKNAYLSGARDNTTAFKGALSAYKAVRAAEQPPAPMPMPAPPPAPSFPTVATNPPIADNFATATGVQPAWGSGVLPSSMGSDPVGAMRMICGAGQVSYDDPIVYPGQPGKSHLHQFYGNVAADASSTYASLRANGGSTCGDPTLPIAVNRSGYWMPAMLDGAGHVVKPMYVAIYYKRIPASDPRCHPETNPDTAIGFCVGIPTGLRWITGYNFQGGANDSAALFYCQDTETVKALDGSLKANMALVVPLCPVGARLTLNISGPDCWDGKNLDSADHRTHVGHSRYFTNANNVSVQQCDAAHPYHMPAVSIIAFYTVDANFAAGKWHLSSDEMVAGAVAGTTFHADYWEAWSPGVRDGWTKNCIDAHMSCQGGELGDGTQIKGMTVPNTQALIPVPAHP